MSDRKRGHYLTSLDEYGQITRRWVDDETVTESTQERTLLCYVRGVYGDIYKVSRIGTDGFRVEVANTDHPAPVVYRAWEILDAIGKGLYEVVPAPQVCIVENCGSLATPGGRQCRAHAALARL